MVYDAKHMFPSISLPKPFKILTVFLLPILLNHYLSWLRLKDITSILCSGSATYIGQQVTMWKTEK
jgi:hypothetical protein